MARRAAVMRVQVCVLVSGVGGGTARWRGVTAGQVEAVLPMKQHLLLVALQNVRGRQRSEQGHRVNRLTVVSSLNTLNLQSAKLHCLQHYDYRSQGVAYNRSIVTT